jgi:hypothetical protein
MNIFKRLFTQKITPAEPPRRNWREEWEAQQVQHQLNKDVHIRAEHNSDTMLCGKTLDWLHEHQPKGATTDPWMIEVGQYNSAYDFFQGARSDTVTCPECRMKWDLMAATASMKPYPKEMR